MTFVELTKANLQPVYIRLECIVSIEPAVGAGTEWDYSLIRVVGGDYIRVKEDIETVHRILSQKMEEERRKKEDEC